MKVILLLALISISSCSRKETALSGLKIIESKSSTVQVEVTVKDLDYPISGICSHNVRFNAFRKTPLAGITISRKRWDKMTKVSRPLLLEREAQECANRIFRGKKPQIQITQINLL